MFFSNIMDIKNTDPLLKDTLDLVENIEFSDVNPKLEIKQEEQFKIEDHEFRKPPTFDYKVENILKGRLDSIPSPSPSVKIQIMGGKVYLRQYGKTLLGVVNKLLKTKSLLTSPSNVLPYYLEYCLYLE